MEIFVIRHTATLLKKGICYGQAEVPLDKQLFHLALPGILSKLPRTVAVIYSSPLTRCSALAAKLLYKAYPEAELILDDRLKELDFGEWELKNWNDINQQDLEKWMLNFDIEKVPGGESFLQLQERVTQFWRAFCARGETGCIVTHHGVIISLLSIINNTAIKDAFQLYHADFGEVFCIKTHD